MKGLVQLQRRLLEAALQFVRPGGVLVYSTCSIEPEENEQIVETFHRSHPRLKIKTLHTRLPPRDNMDGAFCAKILVPA
jgi:16S rRNA (cytosine967-C5)-methyltransferase